VMKNKCEYCGALKLDSNGICYVCKKPPNRPLDATTSPANRGECVMREKIREILKQAEDDIKTEGCTVGIYCEYRKDQFECVDCVTKRILTVFDEHVEGVEVKNPYLYHKNTPASRMRFAEYKGKRFGFSMGVQATKQAIKEKWDEK